MAGNQKKISALSPVTPTTSDSVPIYQLSSAATKRVLISALSTLLFSQTNVVNTDQILDGAITTAKIAADTITGADINWSATGADAGIWWEEIGRTTLGTAGDTISVTSLPARKYLRIFVSVTATAGTVNTGLRFNNDTANNYSDRSSTNGAADGAGTSASRIGFAATDSTAQKFTRAEIINISAQEKLVIGQTIESSTAGAGTSPSKVEFAGKWANTSAQISRIDVVNLTGTGDYAIGSEVIVLGHN